MFQSKIIETTPSNIAGLGICGYKNPQTPGFSEKVEWFKKQYNLGLRIKTLFTEADGNQGMIEYIPGKYCWRPVNAKGYMFIHCLFSGFKKEYKGHGFASRLLEICEQDAKNQNLSGVAVVTRKSSFMVGNEIFLRRHYEVIDKVEPDFELLVKKFNTLAPIPSFKEITKYKNTTGLTIIRADQCPYTVKNVNEIRQWTEQELKIPVNLISLQNHKEAQNSACPFGTFCIIHNGDVIAWHPISKTRFINIMKQRSPERG